jgi:hypothetical protein
MSLDQKQNWITGEEYGRERRRLLEAGASDDSPEMKELEARVDLRDDCLFEKYGKGYMETHHGKWIAISVDGQVIITDTASELGSIARKEFGPGNFSKRKLNESGGHRLF